MAAWTGRGDGFRNVDSMLCGSSVLFDIDDYVFDVDYTHLIMSSLDQDIDDSSKWHDWFSYVSRLGATLKLCDAAITTNEYLAERMSRFAGIGTAVVPNFMNREQLDLSEQIFEARRGHVPAFMSSVKKVGVLTGGGDAPGLNAVIRAVVKTGHNAGIIIVGLEDSFDGLIFPERSRVLTLTLEGSPSSKPT